MDVSDVPAIHKLVEGSFEKYDRIDVAVSNAGYGLFGAAEELSDTEIDHIIATNLTGSIQLIKSVLPHLRKQGGGRIVRLSSYSAQVAFPGNSMYHATKFGEGFCEAVAEEVRRHDVGGAGRRAYRVSLWKCKVAYLKGCETDLVVL